MIPGSSSLYAMLFQFQVKSQNATIESDDVVLDVAKEPAFSLSSQTLFSFLPARMPEDGIIGFANIKLSKFRYMRTFSPFIEKGFTKWHQDLGFRPSLL